jgi:hypothetical protein
MPKAKKFLIFVLILLLINTGFFLAWYAFGLRNYCKNYLARYLGKLTKGEVTIDELHISDRQLLAQGITYTSADSSIAVKVHRLSVQYNLTRYLFSGFKISKLISDIEIYKPTVHYSYFYKPKPPKAKKPLVLPDFAHYFKRLQLTEGTAVISAEIPVKILQEGYLSISDSFQRINLTAINKSTSDVTLNAFSAKGGKLTAKGLLDKGRLAKVDAEIASFRPLSVSHPDLQNLQTEISLVASLTQDTLKAPLKYKAEAQIWGTETLFAGNYPVLIPYLWVKTDGRNLNLSLSHSNFGSSEMEGEVRISNLDQKMKFDYVTATANIDLSMFHKELQGYVVVQAKGYGTIDKPELELNATSTQAKYQKYAFRNLNLTGSYNNNELAFNLPELVFENQIINCSGNLNPLYRTINAHLETKPIKIMSQPYLATANLDVYAELWEKYPFIDATINQLDFNYDLATLQGVRGKVKLIPLASDNNLYLDANISGDNGFNIKVIGDIISRNLLLDAKFDNLEVAELYSQPKVIELNPYLNGDIKAIITGENVLLQTLLGVKLDKPVPVNTPLDALGTFNYKTKEASLHLIGKNGMMNYQPLNFELSAMLKDNLLTVQGFKFNDFISLSGAINLSNYRDLNFALNLKNIGYLDIVHYFPQLDINLPEFYGLNVFAEYNRENLGKLRANAYLSYIDLLAVTPFSLKLELNGPVDSIQVAGNIHNSEQNILILSGNIGFQPELNISLDAGFQDLAIQNVIINSPLTGKLNGIAGITWHKIEERKPELELRANLLSEDITIKNFTINTAVIQGKQTPQQLIVDSLFVQTAGLFKLNGSGAINYNALYNEFFEGPEQLNLNVEGELFGWLKNLTPYILEAKGRSSLSISIGTSEDQFLVSSGKININNGFIRLKDQTEPLANINIRGGFDKNRLIIEYGQVQMGEGKLIFNNIFEADNSDHFMLGFLDLGIFRAMCEEPGILVNIPKYTTPRSLTKVILRGQNSRYATIRGPFDQMKISGEAVASNTNVLYPPDTENLLTMASTVRGSTKKKTSEPNPLPFILDVKLIVGENVKYVTYPAELRVVPGGYLHLAYDGLSFFVKEASFSSEQGTVDIFGTIFQVEKVNLTLVDSQNLLGLEGIFYKRAPDGSMITLSAITSSDYTKSFMERLQLSLTSDNPEDKTISQILARLHYTGTETPDRTQGEFWQDEALGLISGNLDASLFTPILSPIENYIRRTLHLDSFTINAGFIQNLYTEYTNNPQQFAEYTDMNQLSSDIAKFSSSILLNNLSISMSKYLGSSIFLDYMLKLQEATNLQNRTRILVSNEASIRLILPKNYRVAYTVTYEAQEKKTSHEIMLSRFIRFWGL